MKNVVYSNSFFSNLKLTFFPFTCIGQTFNPNIDSICKLEKGRMIILVKEEVLKKSVLEANEDFVSVESIEMEGTQGANNWYLIALGKTNDGNSISLAVPISTVNGGGIYKAAFGGGSHLCKGFFCASCKFTTDGNGKVDGCDCKRESATIDCKDGGIGTSNSIARCDHSVSTGATFATIK